MRINFTKRTCVMIAGCGLLLSAGLCLSALLTEEQSPLLGTGRGIDHVGIAVRDLAAAANLYRDTLGFTVNPGGKHPWGTANASIRFQNHTYLELITVYDRQKAAKDNSDMIAFLDKHEGALFLGLSVSSANETAGYLRSRGFEVFGPTGGTITPEGVKETPPELWKGLGFKKPTVPGDTIFFVEYNLEARQRLREKYPQLKPDPASTVHGNGAIKLYAVWMSVKSLEAATKAYESVGFTAGPKRELPRLDAVGQEIKAGAGVILLVAPAGVKGAAASFLDDRGESVMGVSVEVADLEKTRSVLEQKMGRQFAEYAGLYGKSILVSPEFTKGVWIEFFEKSKSSSAAAVSSRPGEKDCPSQTWR